MKRLLAALFFLAATAHGQLVVTTPRGVVVAHDGRVELFANERRVWSTEGVEATSIVTSDERVAVLDALGNKVRIIELSSGAARMLRTGETPVDGLFLGRTLYLLERDARALARIDADGTRASVAVAADPAFLRTANGLLYVYSRTAGVVQEVDPDRLTVVRSVRVAPFASDFEIDGRTAYLLHPREAKVRTIALTSLKTGELHVGAVPVDLAVTPKSTALSARTLAIADPSAKKVWLVEGAQSLSQAVARGFLRGLLGLGLAANRTSQFPTGVDRVSVSGRIWLAYDSSSGTLYRFTKSRSTALARDVPAGGWAATAEGAVVWQEGRLRTLR